MKFLVVTKDDCVSRFSLSEVRSYHVLKRKRQGVRELENIVRVVMRPTKGLDNDGRGIVVDTCDVSEFKFESFELANSAVRIE